MKALLWISAGAAALGTALLVKKTSAATSVDPEYGESTKVALAVPPGWRRVTGAEVSALPELRSQASALQNASGFKTMQYGTLSPFVASDGRTYATWIEQHYHPPGGATKPWGLHHGVTLLTRSDVGVGVGALSENYYIWWVERDYGSQWYPGWKLLSDEALWRFEYDLERGTPGVRRLYRWFWDGQGWQYDTRNAMALYFRAGERQYASD